MRRAIQLLVACLVLTGCASASPSATAGPIEGPGGIEGLTADLERARAVVKPASQFAGDPLPASGFLICVSGEPVRVYVFSSAQERLKVTSTIDRNDPSKVGTSMVDWMGTPRFWQRDRILVLYLGTKGDTENLLTSVLGPPFARGQGRPPMIPDACS
jgi:hypothetical protein